MDAKTPEQYTAEVVADINRTLAEQEAAAQPAFRVAFMETGRNSYEVHAAGCKHLNAKRVGYHVAVAGATGAEVAARFAVQNEGCHAVLGPCAR